MRQKKPALLVVMSILVIIVGAIEIVGGLIGAIGGGALAYAGAALGSGALVGMGIAVAVLSLIGGILELAAGICSVRGRALGFCMVIAIICIALSALMLGSALYSGAGGPLIGFCVVPLAFNVLYLIGLILGRRAA